jgi:hypothetical protein
MEINTKGFTKGLINAYISKSLPIVNEFNIGMAP